MKLATFLAADKIVLNFHADGQKETLEMLSAPLIKAGVITSHEAFVADLIRRESEITTVMDNGIAIPHARSNAVRRIGLTVGIAKGDGIQFGPDEGVLSRLFFCIAVPAYAPTAHIPLLQLVAQFSRDPKRVEKLLKSKTPSVASRYLGNFRGH
tara:strand:- start:212 stop:673 length:462 start_codon:yes stop_codon:yes gene_type:complete